jgi:hypothetical protein
MNTELTVTDDSGRSIAEMMGVTVQEDSKRRSSLARLTQIHKALMGDIEVAGKVIKTEVVPSGAYKLDLKGDEQVAYCLNPVIRIFALRQQWTHWDAENNKMDRSMMATDLKGDLKDTRGTFNIGRPSGYVEDWESLPQATKDIMRSVKRTKILFGTINLAGVMDEAGNAVEGFDRDIPFIMDIKNRDSIKALDNALKLLARKNVLPIQYNVVLSAEEHTMPTGNTYASMVFQLKDAVAISEEDNEVLKGFFDWMEWTNSYVKEQWESNNTDSIAGDFVDIEGVAV